MPQIAARPKHPFRHSRQTVLVGLSVLTVAIALVVGIFLQIAGYRLISIDQRDQRYPSVVARQIARDAPQSPFVVEYPVTKQPVVDARIHAYINQLMNDYIQERSKRQDTTDDEQLQVGYEIRWYDNRTLTVDFIRQKHQINRIWDKYTETLTFDLVTGAQLNPANVIKSTLGLANILYDYRRAHNHAQWTSAELITLLDLNVASIKAATPYGNEIGFTYSVGGRTETIGINKALLGDIVHPAYHATTSDKTLQQPSFPELISTMPSRDEPINPNGKKLALTFDDGPGSDTPRLLDALYKYRAHATFFVVGKNVAPGISTIKRELADGHEIGNHTWGHPNLRKLSGGDIDRQVQDTQAAVRQASGGYTPRLIRPPYGSIDPYVTTHLQGLLPALWTVDTQDWLIRDTNVIYDRIMGGAQQGSVILLHDIHSHSVDAAIRAIRQLRAEGWQLVTVSQL